MTSEKFEKGKKIYDELMDCSYILQELTQSYEIVLNICYANSYTNKNSMRKADEEVKCILIQYYEDKLAKLTKQFNEV